MKLPRFSVGSIMIVLVVVAIDCATLRLIATNQAVELRLGHFTGSVLAILAMTNVLAVALSRMIRDGFRARPSRLGFALGGLIGMIATVLAIEPTLDWLVKSSLARPWISAVERWLGDSSIRPIIALVGIVGVLPFLFQFLLAVAGGWLFRRLSVFRDGPSIEGRQSLGRRLGSIGVLVILLALPIPTVESWIRWKLDPNLARLSTGREAVVVFSEFDGSGLFGPFLPKGSPWLKLAGAKVRVESDDQPMMLEIERMGTDEKIWDSRPVRVTLLDGQRSGETLDLLHRWLRPVR